MYMYMYTKAGYIRWLESLLVTVVFDVSVWTHQSALIDIDKINFK